MGTHTEDPRDTVRLAKATKLAEALQGSGIRPCDAVSMDDRSWGLAEQIAGIRPASDITRLLALALLMQRCAPGTEARTGVAA